MTCESRILKLFIALRRAQTLAAALLLFAVFIGALEAAVPTMQAQQAVTAAPVGSANAAPPPKAEIHPPAESTTEIFARIADTSLVRNPLLSTSITTALIRFQKNNRESQKFSSERKL